MRIQSAGMRNERPPKPKSLNRKVSANIVKQSTELLSESNTQVGPNDNSNGTLHNIPPLALPSSNSGTEIL